MALYEIQQILHPTDTDISPSGTLSREFEVPSASVIRIEGTLTEAWDVESKRKDDETNDNWTSETEATYGNTAGKPGIAVKQIKIDGNPNMLYRINLFNNTAGPHGFVYPLTVQGYR